jgi:hypothetical protein
MILPSNRVTRHRRNPVIARDTRRWLGSGG